MTVVAARSPDPVTDRRHDLRSIGWIAAFWLEECRGRKLAFKLRLVAVGADRSSVAGHQPLAAGALLPRAHARLRCHRGSLADALFAWGRARRLTEWGRWLVPLADMALVTFARLHPNPFGGDRG